MSTVRQFVPRESVDYVYTVNLALQSVLEARARVKDAVTFEEYLRAVEALYVILIPRLRDRRVKDLIERAKVRGEDLLITEENLELLDRAVEMILEVLDRNNLLIRGHPHEAEHL